MKTRQGKEVNYNDILLYSVNMKNIIVIVNDEEQMKKFARTGKSSDAPISVLPYSDEELTNIIDSMKQMVRYEITDEEKTILEAQLKYLGTTGFENSGRYLQELADGTLTAGSLREINAALDDTPYAKNSEFLESYYSEIE